MLILKRAKGLLVLVCVSLCGCGSVLRVTKFDSNNPQGVPFYVKHGVCVQQTVYATPYWRLTLTYSIADGAPTSETLIISDATHSGSDFSALLEKLAREGGPDSQSVLTAWDHLKDLRPVFDPWSSATGQRLLANGSSLTAEVDYKTVYAINQKKPFSGSSQSDFKLAADGTLTEASGQVQENTFATIVSALPLSSLITAAAGIKTPVGKAEQEKPVSAKFALKQEQRYIKVVYSQSSPPPDPICKVGQPLKAGDANVGVALTDVGSTDTVETGTQDKGGDSISISGSGTIKLPKALLPSTPEQNTNDGANKANQAPSSKGGQSTDKPKPKGKS